MDGINSDKSSLPVNDNNEHEQKETSKPVKEDRNALKGDSRPASKKQGKKQPTKKTGDHNPEEDKKLGEETEITDEITI